MKEAVIVAGARTPVGKANRGSFKHVRSDDLGAIAVKETLRRAKQVEPEEIDDCLIGCAMPEAEQGMNMARNVSVLAGIPQSVPAVTINRYCASGLQTIAYGAERIMLGHAKAIIAGGAESMSMIPMGGHVVKPNPTLIDEAPEYYMSMGYTAEEVARQYGISREDQDVFAVESHKRAAAALANQRFSDEIVPVPVVEQHFGSNGTLQSTERLVEIDEGVRADTTIAALSKLKPAFQHKGTVTAGNSSQMSDGAAAVLLMDKEEAEARGLEPLVTFKSFAVAGVAPEVMGVGPIEAIPKAVRLAGLQLEEIGLFELNEAFASQALAVIRELGLDYDKVNVNGGAIALGHPLGCTGTKLTLSLIHEMRRRDERFGVVTMCIGGGMGAAAVFERH
ncbi:acetyl-CoA C-acetyltransferase [Shouchella clausii]|uniref:acetyl-CoA C-acetyltransferase n=1 Tax=Shouchella clausii TaxID=79880 RepID=UPI000B963F76|nr:acetyl-CoA C-acetyltransferase [Shouchella clausii]AST96802.1 acetyl-CoA acetyltransferase [Shouchella clausii]MCR1287257.1 acetyl-CoA C-acetyltransferase [Shouchella clausii]MEB5471597.1 acetyl-CoA C-acetyltransferase [Shouchella clausii]MEB5481885.1 acetyl-CoA C-acetyltransferase [Shouchella clausii]PAE93282.1 acetyl-CoA acetyltransferase [Shouchella clausii]